MFEEAMQQPFMLPTPDRLRAMEKQCRRLHGDGGCPCATIKVCRVSMAVELMAAVGAGARLPEPVCPAGGSDVK